MQIIKANNLACPLDGTPLFGDKSLHCDNGHSFDMARQGYLHLLPVQNKKSREPGDSKKMVAARSRFLDAGFYLPISEQLNLVALQHLPQLDDLCVVDAGCGEGYYLNRFCAALMLREGGTATLIGLDISKFAVMAAARRNKQITWLVASNNNPAVQPQSVDMIFCMFGFPVYDVFKKILKPGGKVVLVEAGADHLLELRQVIYPEVRKSEPPALDKAEQAGFALIDSQPLCYQTAALNREQIGDLLVMTPHLFRATREGKAAAAELESLVLTVDLLVRVLALPAH
ncbi:MAG: methyltransferase domain-containing protein [Pseudomonadota bacterium]|nr:methyltransferase domain-containing protein [Pseudomonadota bacterium]